MSETDRIDIRLLAARDSLTALTQLLHRAYAPLAAAGVNYSAATQTVADTERNIAQGQCFVAECRGRIVGTITVRGPLDAQIAPWAVEVPAFCDRDTAHFHQFAVDPEFQRRGIARQLVSACERWARERGYRRMALDTAEPAGLRAAYAAIGYVEVGQVQWQGKSYRSLILEKQLDDAPLRTHLLLMARYHRWATAELLQHLQRVPEADYRRPLGLFFGSVHGTLNHLLLAERELWMPRLAQGVSPALALDRELEPGREPLAAQVLAAAAAWSALVESWPLPRLLGTLEYRRGNGQSVTVASAAALAHVFNHGTHHRGQLSAALTTLGRPCPELDLIRMLQQEQARA